MLFRSRPLEAQFGGGEQPAAQAVADRGVAGQQGEPPRGAVAVAGPQDLAPWGLQVDHEVEGGVDERAALYRRAERAVLEQRAVKPVVQYRTRYLLREPLTGLVVDALGGAFTGYVGMAGR